MPVCRGLPPGTRLRGGRPHFFPKKWGERRGGRGISISPALHPPLETTNQGGAAAPPYWMYPPGCPTGSFPAEGAYVVTPPRLGAGAHIGAPLRGARRPRRAVVGLSCGSFASGQARKLIPSAGPPLPTEPASLGFGGGPNYRKRQPIGRAAMRGWFLPCPYSPPLPWAPVFWGGAGGTPRPFFPPLSLGKEAGPRPSRRRRGRFQ